MSQYDLIDLSAKYKSRTKGDTVFAFDIFDNEIFTCSGEKKNGLTFQLSIRAFICFKMTLDVSFALSYDYAFTFSTGFAGTTRTTNELGLAACRHFSKRSNFK